MDITRKDKSALDRHRNPSPEVSAHDVVVACESIITTFTCVYLNDAGV